MGSTENATRTSPSAATYSVVKRWSARPYATRTGAAVERNSAALAAVASISFDVTRTLVRTGAAWSRLISGFR